MNHPITVRQIVQKIGRKRICRLTKRTEEAPRKWYSIGIPEPLWPILIKAEPQWLDAETLFMANQAARKFRRKN